MKWILSLLTSLLFCLALEAGARADGPSSEAKAREYYQTASANFEAGKYIDAEAGFAAGYELSHKPGFLWNMAECARLQGNVARALELYKQYLAQAPSDAPQRAAADAKVHELEPKPVSTSVTLSVAPAASPVVLIPNPVVTNVFRTELPPAKEQTRPITKRWWFWTGIAGVVVVAATITAIAIATSSRGDATPSGTYVVHWN